MLKVMAEFVSEHPSIFFELVPEISVGALSGRLAKVNPDLFLKLTKRHVAGGMACSEVIAHMLADQKVPAIKAVRVAWGLGLKEAKDVVDNVHHTLYNAGKMKADYTGSATLVGLHLQIYNQIMEHA
jgi:hypothetical protein